MKPRITTLAAALALCLAAPDFAAAQTVGAKVPPYQAPAKVAPRPMAEGETGAGFEKTSTPDPLAAQADLVSRFKAAYDGAGQPRLAFYWNRQLSDTLAGWYADSRTVATTRDSKAVEGDLSLTQKGTRQSATETQRRTAGDDPGRPTRAETWEWEFQDGFLAPFLEAGAHMADRTAITRIMGAGAEDMDPRTVEVMAIQTMADLMVEVLVADSAQSTTGYELRARILDTRTGRIVAMVNSRGLREWQKSAKAVATAHGFELPDEDDDSFGPERADRRFKATSSGFERSRKPPKPQVVARNLAYNVMAGLLPQLESGAIAPPAAKAKTDHAAQPVPEPATTAPDPAPTTAAPKPPKPSESAVPLPDVEQAPLPAPEGAKTAGPTEAEEPPMPRPTAQ